MIRFRRLPRQLLDAWLVDQHVNSTHRRYRIRVWRENRVSLAEIQAELVAYINEAFDDARRHLRSGFEDNLSPFLDLATDPAAHYPAILHRFTLQGYLGEILAGLAIEHWGAQGHTDWFIPAFLFRFHEQEFQHLEAINERLRDGEPYNPDRINEVRPGRTGDDGLAFRISRDNIITDILTIEAKCVEKHNNRAIVNAHKKLSAGDPLPSGIHELINLLNHYNTPEAQTWQEALLRVWQDGYRVAGRYDGIAYICGQTPARAKRISWMPTDMPHQAYTVRRYLEGIEIQLSDVATIIDTILRGI
jgi:hypothetical protein